MKSCYIETLVSVIIPVYNAERFIEEALQSALGQTYENIEVIIVDDCSNDNSSQIIHSFINRDNRIKYYKLNKNVGAAVARNTGINHANGRYIAFLDSDDIWIKDKIEKQLILMKEKNAAISYTAIEMINEKGKLVKTKRHVKEIVDYKYILKNTMIACSSVIIDREITGDFQMPLLRAGQDYATWLQLMRNGIKAYGINEVLVKYRRVKGSVSSNKWKSPRLVWSIHRKNENLSKIRATYCTAFFTLNAIRKYYF